MLPAERYCLIFGSTYLAAALLASRSSRSPSRTKGRVQLPEDTIRACFCTTAIPAGRVLVSAARGSLGISLSQRRRLLHGTYVRDGGGAGGSRQENCEVAEEVNTFTIHLGIFTSDNLLAKLGKLAGLPALRTVLNSVSLSFSLSSPLFFSYIPRGMCARAHVCGPRHRGVPNERMTDFAREFYGNS